MPKSKRLFLIGWNGRELGLIDVVSKLVERSHEIVYWSGYRILSEADQSQFPTTIFHDYDDALAGRPAPGVDVSAFAPPSEELITKLYETESMLLTMMNKKYEWMGVSERKRVYYRMLRYWKGVLEKYQPDLVIFPVVPHTVYDYVIYSLSQLLGIKTIMFDLTRVNGRLVLINDYKEGSVRLQKELASGSRLAPTDSVELSPDIQEHYAIQTDPNADATPPDTTLLVGHYKGPKLLLVKLNMIKKSFVDLSIFKKVLAYVYKQFKSNLKKEYMSVAVPPDFSKKFVYAPLSYQPECSTTPLGGIFADQILMLETLSAAIPPEWLIYVKEHPFQWLPRGLVFFSYRPEGYYKEIAKIKNVRIVPLETDTYKLINYATAIGTVTGTAGWEGLTRGIPALVFGFPWYQYCPGVFRVRDAGACRSAFEHISTGFVVNRESVQHYLACLDKVSFKGYYDSYGQSLVKISREENIKNFLGALITAIETD